MDMVNIFIDVRNEAFDQVHRPDFFHRPQP